MLLATLKVLAIVAFILVLTVVTAFLVLGAIGMSVFNADGAFGALKILVGLAVVSIGGGWLAHLAHRMPVVAIGLALASVAASIGVSALAATMMTFAFSQMEQFLVLGILSVAIGLLALGVAGFSGCRAVEYARGWIG